MIRVRCAAVKISEGKRTAIRNVGEGGDRAFDFGFIADWHARKVYRDARAASSKVLNRDAEMPPSSDCR